MNDSDTPSRQPADSRRDFVRKLAYATPVLLTLPATAAMAQVGSSAPLPDDCEPSIFNDFCAPPPPTDEFGCRLDVGEFPTFGPDGEFISCSS